MNLKIKLVFIVIFLFCSTMQAQEEVTIKGTVASKIDGEPILGANIIVLNTNKGTSTDFDGNYQIKVKTGEIIQFSYLGFTTKTIPYVNQKRINIDLAEDENLLDEIIVVGYGTQKKSHLTGAISKITNESLDQIAVARVDEALVGQVSGVNIQATEGEAGSAPTIRIRGTGSINGNSDPAIVVDGLVVDIDFLSNLDMNEVASFEVLKDAASAAIYGSRGANGVILITTKSGKAGETKFTYNTFTGFKEARKSEQYAGTLADWSKRELAATGMLSDKTKYKQLIGTDRDWQDVMFELGIITSYSFSARGGNDKTKFSFSMNYLEDEGVLLTDNFKKYSMRIKTDTKVNDKFSFGVNLSPSYSNTRRFDGSTHDVLKQSSWLPIYHDDNTIQYVDRAAYPNVEVGDYAIERHFDNYNLDGNGSLVDISTTSNTNPFAKVSERDRNDYKFKLFGSIYAKYRLAKGLSFKTTFAGDFENTKKDRWQGVLASRNGSAAAQLDISAQNRIHITSDNLFSYNREIGNHEISAIAGFSMETFDWEYEDVTGTGYTSDLLQTITAATVIAEARSFKWERNLLSYLGRVNYAYDDKYLVSLSFRRDGYSVFGENQKYGNFPAASVGWTVSKEDFLKDSYFLNFLKFRFSYGKTGNPEVRSGGDALNSVIDSNPYLSLIGPSTAVSDTGVVSGFNPLNIANPNLQWESSVEFNPAVDFGFLNNRITGSVDYYQRTSDKLLLFNPISSTTGFTNALTNLGKVKNSGVEFELRTKNVSKPSFKWSSTFIATHNKNELLDFADSNGQIQNVDNKRAAEWINLVGNPISSFYGWVVDEEIPIEYIARPWERARQTNREVYVKDLNGDGVIDDDDKTILGNPYPDLVWSISNNFNIGDFDASFMFQGSHGAEVRNIADQYIFQHAGSSSLSIPSITPIAPESTEVVSEVIQSTPGRVFIREKIFTNSIIQNASYVALRTVNLGYTLDADVAAKLKLSKLRMYITGQNLMYLTASDYTGLNPESIRNTSGTTYGYQRAGSPINRTISLGFNLEF
jgi:TonB-linked SusC/RagA family outer membrane protein